MINNGKITPEISKEIIMIRYDELLMEFDKLPPKYFIELFDFVKYLQQKTQNLNDNDAAAYQAMATDTEREQEAREWCNANFG
jgi:hypothetical protein